jgi:type VI secretion system secreted protein Hcp
MGRSRLNACSNIISNIPNMLVSNTGTAHVGSGAGGGKVSVHDLTLTKLMDKASPALFLNCCSGKHFPQAVLTVRKAGGHPVEYCKIKLTEVLISSVTTGAAGHERLIEHVTLNFAQVNLDYIPQDAKGAAGTATTMGWDITANSPA